MGHPKPTARGLSCHEAIPRIESWATKTRHPHDENDHGTVYGKTIELDEDLGVAEGQEVEVQVTIVPTIRKRAKVCYGHALADDLEWDAIMERIHQERTLNRRPPIEQE